MRDRDRLGVGPGGGDRRYSGQGRRAHRGQLFQQQERGGSDRGSLPQGRRRRRWSSCRATSSRDEDCKKIVAAAAPWGRLDALINNAGTTKHVAHDKLDELSAEDFQRIFAVNTIGPYQMMRAARALLEAGAKASGKPAAVVNISSVAGICGGGSSVAYAASKGALNTMTLSLSRALAPLIRVNTVCPGYIDTPWFTKGRGEAGAKQVRDLALDGGETLNPSTYELLAGIHEVPARRSWCCRTRPT